MPSREKQGFCYARGFLEPVDPIPLPLGALLILYDLPAAAGARPRRPRGCGAGPSAASPASTGLFRLLGLWVLEFCRALGFWGLEFDRVLGFWGLEFWGLGLLLGF